MNATAAAALKSTKADARSRWIRELVERRNKNIATVALANKHARISWAMLARGAAYRPSAKAG